MQVLLANGFFLLYNESMTHDIEIVPDKRNIETQYNAYTSFFKEILVNIENRLHSVIHLSSLPTYKARVKSFSSYYKKVLRLKSKQAAEGAFVTLTDMIGIRVICSFLDDIEQVKRQVAEAFEIVEVEVKGANQTFNEFGYESVHVLVTIPEDCYPKESPLPIPQGLVCEIQVRTILQDAWAEVEHELIYKSEFTPFDMPLRRKLASINASLSLADIIFQEIRDYQNRLQGELADRRERFYGMADFLTGGHKQDLPKPEDITSRSPFVHGTIDDMLLEALQEHNAGNLDRACEIYSRILEAQPQPAAPVMSVIYKHRGMAHFAQNKYADAVADFSGSIAFDPKNFRSWYYKGIVFSVESNYKEAVDCFTKSLEINDFQAHTHYRRALAYFNLGEHDFAMNDLDAAAKLGLDDEDCKTLRNKLVQKYGMGM